MVEDRWGGEKGKVFVEMGQYEVELCECEWVSSRDWEWECGKGGEKGGGGWWSGWDLVDGSSRDTGDEPQ